ncbi:MAG: hypothetical protein WC657_06770, partial [Candidatus Paceibacterota bacterium]
MRVRYLLPAVVVFVVTGMALSPSALSLPQHGDELMYIWKAAYYADRLIRLDFDGGDPNSFVDPGWSPFSFWALEQPWGSHAIYALALDTYRVSPPSLSYSRDDASSQGPLSDIPDATLPIVRGTAIFCAAIGLSLIALRLGWAGAIACLLFLLIPHVRGDLARAWAEGPLLLGIGMSVLSFGSPWFPLCVGLATGFKLSAIVLWPAVWLSVPIRFPRIRHAANLLVAGFAFAVTTPYSWQAGGPLYLIVLLVGRAITYIRQSTVTDGPLESLLASERVFGL